MFYLRKRNIQNGLFSFLFKLEYFYIKYTVYNLISVPQITRLLLGDATISSKTEPHNGSKKDKRSYGKVRNNKTMLKFFMLNNNILQRFAV